MLQADTSGGHAVEIAQLQKEIAEAQQGYQRTLEDQLLERMQNQADEASKQRQRQIEHQETILDEINNAAEVNKWMNNPEAYRAEIFEAFKTANEYNKKPEALQEQLDREFEVLMNGLITNQEKQDSLITSINILAGSGGLLDQVSQSIKALSSTGTVQKDNAKTTTSVATVQSVASLTPKSTTTTANKTTTTAAKSTATTTSAQQKKNEYTNAIKAVKKKKPANVKPADINNLFTKGSAAGYGKATVLSHLVGSFGGSDPFTWKNIFRAIIDANGIDRYNLVKTWPNGSGTLADAIKTLKSNPNTYAEIKKHKKYKSTAALKFKTGGLADYTGPAWLDGTPSKPELVLNAQDTKNFMTLRDVLSHAMGSTSNINNSYSGDATYEININVDKLTSDYDVDKVADKVKKIIVKDSSYRNVTQVRKFR